MPPRPTGPFPAAFAAPPGSLPPGPTPIGGLPAQRSPLVVSGPRSGPDDHTSFVERSEPSIADRWEKVRAVLAARGPIRWGLVGVLALVQTFVLFSAVMWWVGSSAPSATATVAPMTWTGIVYDVGTAGLNLRADPQVRSDDARDTAARGARLALSCGETGDVVAKGPVKTATWLRTTDGLFVSMLYVRVPDRQSIPSCNGSKVDGPLIALADPAHPDLPPPPGTRLGADPGAMGVAPDPGVAGGQPPAARAAGAPSAPVAGSPPESQPGATALSGTVQAKAQAPAAGSSMGNGTADSHANTAGPGTSVNSDSHAPSSSENAPSHESPALAHHDVTNPDTTPVG